MPGIAHSVDLRQENVRLSAENTALKGRLTDLQQRIDWFTRQLFGQKSEKRLDVDPAIQADLLAGLGVPEVAIPEAPQQTITYTRRKKQFDPDCVNEAGLRFSDAVPVRTIHLTPPHLDEIPEDQRELIGEKVTHRLAQRPGSYEVLKYVLPVIKRKDTQAIVNTPAPPAVIEGSVADVSFLAGMLIDKFCYHLPLYRQHQRLADAGITLSRASLTQMSQRAISLLEPVAAAQFEHILQSDVLAMDETPIKAGRKGKGKLNQGYFWPVYGDADEIGFCYSSNRGHANVQALLGQAFSGTLISDGYEAYAKYARLNGQVTHAQCWSHARRGFEKAKDADPDAAEQALSLIGVLYRHEKTIRDDKLTDEDALAYRTRHSEPAVRAFWQWCDAQCQRHDLIPSHPLGKALKYAMARQHALQVFLSDPRVPIDTNHLERALRAIPMGRKNWLFCWTELGAEHVGIVQSLLVTCRLQGVDPYAYLVDVLQRIDQHPAKSTIELTPRLWKTMFADSPLRSDAHVDVQ